MFDLLPVSSETLHRLVDDDSSLTIARIVFDREEPGSQLFSMCPGLHGDGNLNVISPGGGGKNDVNCPTCHGTRERIIDFNHAYEDGDYPREEYEDPERRDERWAIVVHSATGRQQRALAYDSWLDATLAFKGLRDLPPEIVRRMFNIKDDKVASAAANLNRLVEYLEGFHYRHGTEEILQSGLETVLRDYPVLVQREAIIGPGCRVDFWISDHGIAVEAKTQGGPADVLRQLDRYAELELVRGVLLVTSSYRLNALINTSLRGKPVRTVHLRGGAA